MEWYSDNISAGIAESKSKQLIFLVHIFDPKNEIDNQLWSNESVIKTCKENCISLKLDAESQTCSFFKQIYPVTEYPTTYMIGLDGKPLEVISGELSLDEFISKFQKAIEAHNLVKNPVLSQAPSTSGHEPKIPDVPSESTSETEQKKHIDDRVAKAKEKLKEIQEKKRAEEEEKERNNEMERRKLGQEILRVKREKEEQELRKIAEEKRKEKIEDDLAKKRILEKIRQDREEKQRKYQQEKETTEQTQEAQ
ncbi:UBX domain-containing 4-like, partial [Brachionus plicatilis]